jgi:hypothetical protein
LVPEVDFVGDPELPEDPVDPEDPDEPDEPDDVEVVAAVATGVAAWWAWKPSTAAVPTTVAEMTMGARFMVGCSSEGE